MKKCKVLKCRKNIYDDEFNGYCENCHEGVIHTNKYIENLKKLEEQDDIKLQ